jgi:adenylosuccinate synthase
MPVTVVVGGQFGSEGKGKVAHYLAVKDQVAVAARVGGPNSGHTVIGSSGDAHIFRQLPTAAIEPEVKLVIAAGSYIDVDILLEEIERHNVDPERVFVDPLATIILPRHRQQERDSDLGERIASTGSGTGAALKDRISRNPGTTLARDEPRLKNLVRIKTKEMLHEVLRRDGRLLIEGTQGFGLSLLHAEDYPYVTSRDTTAAAFVSEVGVSPLFVDQISLVLRAFPIRVGGNSGPLPSETSWPEVSRKSGSPCAFQERTSVTKTVRRVAAFDPTVVHQAILANNPTQIVLNHLDHVDHGCRDMQTLPLSCISFLENIERQIDHPVDIVGVAPNRLISNPLKLHVATRR